tara:strand:+ start:1649 stop:3379 length:1731 start_codon:yes stop_codon:yes gene_type:complete
MNPLLIEWLQKSLKDGSTPIEIAAAIARGVANNKGLLRDSSEPELLSCGNLVAPDEIEYNPELVGAVYEHCLDSSIRRNGGVHYTPTEVAQKLTGIALSKAPPGPVCDPSVGGGSFLLAAANAFQALGLSPSVIVEDLLWGIDIDPDAIRVTKTVLALWASEGEWIVAEKNLVTADSLETGIEAFQSPPDRGFSAVIGNPPFQNQLQHQTVRTLESTNQLRDRWKTFAGPYADTAGFFLLVGSSMLSEKGILLMIQPQSFLSAADSLPIRENLEEQMDLIGMWIGGSDIFEAGVHVCAPIFGPLEGESQLKLWDGPEIEERPTIDRRKKDNWTEIISAVTGVPCVNLQGPELKNISSSTAGFRDQFYGLKEYVSEKHLCQGNWAPLITVGMIDPFRNRWGQGTFRYANKNWIEPVVDLDALRKGNLELFHWVKDRLRPKILVATQTKILEVLPDPEGRLIPSTPVISVECDYENIWLISAALSSPAASARAFARAAGAAMSSDTLKLSATQISEIPLPERTFEWNQGAEYAQQAYLAESEQLWAAYLHKLGQETAKAYEIDNDVFEWWLNRLPAWR